MTQSTPTPPPPPTADFSALFDLTFTRFLTVGVIKIIYLLGIILVALAWLGMVIGAFGAAGFLGGLLGIVIATIVAVVNLLILRVWLELIVVLFRIGENTARIAGALGSGPSTGGFPVIPVAPTGQPV